MSFIVEVRFVRQEVEFHSVRKLWNLRNISHRIQLLYKDQP